MSTQRLERFIELEKLRPNRWNCNCPTIHEFEALREGMKNSGLENTPPIFVRHLPEGFFEIIDGEQRCRVAKDLGWRGMYALLTEASDNEVKYRSLSLNHARGSIDPLRLFDLLYEEWREGEGSLSMGELEEKYHGLFSQKYIQKVLALREISQEARAFIVSYRSSDRVQDDFRITLSHLNILAKLKSPNDQVLYCKLMIEMKLSPGELDVQVKRKLGELQEWEKARPMTEKAEEASDVQRSTERQEDGRDAIEPPPPLSRRQRSRPRPQKVEEIFTCPSCRGQFVVNYNARRVQRLDDEGNHLTAVLQEGRPSRVKEACPVCRMSIATIDCLKGEVQWETRDGQ
ncbi:MAG: ParB N-terminal domain-containing protein [Thaumarchaeota archaeon]|nr:ParB N-terminal domain-containing protein [Nitrososphaerota archaeon]